MRVKGAICRNVPWNHWFSPAFLGEERVCDARGGSAEAPRMRLAPPSHLQRGRDGVGVTPANLQQLAAEKAALALRRLLLQVGLPFAARREAVHARAVRERALRRRHVLVA